MANLSDKTVNRYRLVILVLVGMLIIAVFVIFRLLQPKEAVPVVPANTPTLTITLTPIPSLTTTATPLLPSPTFEPSLTLTMVFTPTPTSLSTEITDAKGVSMRLVPAGEFIMGLNNSFADVKPEHKVNLDAFYIDKFEVTNGLYDTCVKAQVCEPPKNFVLDVVVEEQSLPEKKVVIEMLDDYYYGNVKYINYPIIYVTWSMARSYCEDWRQARLPTEAEWEKAVRGPSGNYYPWGNQFDCKNGNFGDAFSKVQLAPLHNKFRRQEPKCDGYIGTSPVGAQAKDISFYGVFDLAGNVAEWTSSIFMPYPYSADDGRENLTEWAGRILRGGSFYENGDTLFSYYRTSMNPATYSKSNVGFRCARGVINGKVP